VSAKDGPGIRERSVSPRRLAGQGFLPSPVANAGAGRAEFTYVARDLHKPELVQQFAPSPIAKSADMERRHPVLSTALASSYLDQADNGGEFDVARHARC